MLTVMLIDDLKMQSNIVQYIDKSALVAEIKSKRKYAQTLGDNAINGSMQQFYDGMKQGCVDLLSFLDTLEVKEELVSEDLSDYINELSKQFPEVSFAKLSRIAVRVVKWREQQINLVSKDLKTKAKEYSFNIPSVIFNNLPKELQGQWRKEIENAFINGYKSNNY